jgi:hypothetical protein
MPARKTQVLPEFWFIGNCRDIGEDVGVLFSKIRHTLSNRITNIRWLDRG